MAGLGRTLDLVGGLRAREGAAQQVHIFAVVGLFLLTKYEHSMFSVLVTKTEE